MKVDEYLVLEMCIDIGIDNGVAAWNVDKSGDVKKHISECILDEIREFFIFEGHAEVEVDRDAPQPGDVPPREPVLKGTTLPCDTTGS